jgi:hypothetical protein
MASYLDSYSPQMISLQSNTAISHSHFLQIDNELASFPTVSNHAPKGEIPRSPSFNLNITTHHPSSAGRNESIKNRTASTSIEDTHFSANAKVVTSEGSSIDWGVGKKKKTVSAGLLIALGVAGIVIG